ncbi:MAG: FKBP-type peptidyl-prolyl cis-trans isomerase [Candidatus Cyclobacteriaceae bacterium M2_1C_046]
MNKIFFALLFSAMVVFSSCDEDQTQLEQDIEAIDNYLAENNLDAEVHTSGLRYKIITMGAGESPTLARTVEVSYEGKLMSDGTVFDATPEGETRSFQLSQLIEGWRIGLPLIKEGGKIILYIPSTYGYGSYGTGTIPANSNLIFTIDLVSVK